MEKNSVESILRVSAAPPGNPRLDELEILLRGFEPQRLLANATQQPDLEDEDSDSSFRV